VVMLCEFGGYCLKGDFRPVWEREAGPGLALGWVGAFVVLENRAHATARGATPIARLSAAASGYSRRAQPGAIKDELARMWPRVAGALRPAGAAVISGATGAAPATAEEKDFRAAQSEPPGRATGSLAPPRLQPQMQVNVARTQLPR